MPLFFQKDMDEDTKLGIWKIEEAEGFFLQKVAPQRQVSHPHKKLQHLAGRYLLQYLFPDFPTVLILIADTRKPFLQNEAYHFSISHCGNYAAALVSKNKRVGIDIEVPTPKVEKIKHKFLSEEDMKVVNGQWSMVNSELLTVNRQLSTNNDQQLTNIEQLTLLWACKESVFKWYGAGEVDFKEHIVIQKIKQISDDLFRTEICFQKEDLILLSLHGQLFDEIVLSYVIT